MERKFSNFGNVCNVINNFKAATFRPVTFKGVGFLIKDEPDNFNNKNMNCTECEDSGYVFDTLYPCNKCDLGKPIQHERNKQELERLLKRAKFLRKIIKNYNQPEI